jgi:queuine/archaeosine tRNA-ribosyltransferase
LNHLNQLTHSDIVKRRWWEGKTTEQIQSERFELTLQNAQKFLDLYASQKPTFTPVGIAQGGSADRYYYAVEQLLKMGYEHIALGGMIRYSDADIIAVLEKIRPLIK